MRKNQSFQAVSGTVSGTQEESSIIRYVRNSVRKALMGESDLWLSDGPDWAHIEPKSSLNEAHYEPTVVKSLRGIQGKRTVYPEIGNWISIRTEPKIIKIYQPDEKMPGHVYHMGALVDVSGGATHRFSEKTGRQNILAYLDRSGEEQVVPWDFNDVKNAVRFVYLQSQKPDVKSLKSESSNASQVIGIPGITGWKAKEYEDGWRIYDDAGRFVGFIGNNGMLAIIYYGPNKEEKKGQGDDAWEYGRLDLVGNPVQTARYIYLMTQGSEALTEGGESFERVSVWPDALVDYFSGIPKSKLKFGDVDGYSVVYMDDSEDRGDTNVGDFWFYDKYDNPVGYLFMDPYRKDSFNLKFNDQKGLHGTIGKDWYKSVGWKAPKRGADIDSLIAYLKQAARYIYLQRL